MTDKLCYSIISLAAMLFLLSCEKIIEENIENKSVQIIGPADSLFTNSNTVSFWWDPLVGADTFDIQLVTPSFDNPIRLLVDSSTTANAVDLFLSPGTYEWRIRARNSGYETRYSTPRLIFIDTTSDLAQLNIELLSPADDFVTNSNEVTFVWRSLSAATEFRFILSNTSGSVVYDDVNITDTTITYQVTSSEYTWKVRAQNSYSNTTFSSRSFTVDTIAPTAPSLQFPSDGAIILTDSVTLSWSNPIDAVADSIFIYDDAALTSLTSSYYVTADTFLFSNSNSGPFYWRVRSIDQAGNSSPFSSSRSFTITP